LQTVLYDGWVVRFADGYTNRANSVNPIYDSGRDIQDKISYCRKLYENKGQKTVFKITPAVLPIGLDGLLEEMGYEAVSRTSLQLLDLHDLMEPLWKDVIVYEYLDMAWVEEFCRLSAVKAADRVTLCGILQNIVPVSFYILLQVDGHVVACGSAVLENEMMGLFNIVVDKGYRNNGYGEQLVRHLLCLGRSKGVKHAYLQVVASNLPAVKCYSRVGFKEYYQYWYRVK
jgi:ribosomal protein S18 acetylase RimI-like enzyme